MFIVPPNLQFHLFNFTNLGTGRKVLHGYCNNHVTPKVLGIGKMFQLAQNKDLELRG
jgi:hypothetical protein